MKNRNSNIELLRIISILLIIISHYTVHGIGRTTIYSMDLGFNRFLLESSILGNIGTILFVMISGYFLVNSNEVKIKKVVRLMFQVAFYSIVFYVCFALNKDMFNVKDFIKHFFPVTFKFYWFFTAYIVLYIFHPYINSALNSMNKKTYEKFILLSIIIFSILPTITRMDYYGNEIIQFIIFYSIGAYLNKYSKNKLSNKSLAVKIMISCILFTFLSIIVLDIIHSYNLALRIESTTLLNRNSPVAILFCASMFSYFVNRKEFNSKVINSISPLVFGIYLISDNYLIRPLLWKTIFKNYNYINSGWLIIHMVVAILVTFIVCIIIEYLRKILLEEPLFKRVDILLDKLQNRLTHKNSNRKA